MVNGPIRDVFGLLGRGRGAFARGLRTVRACRDPALASSAARLGRPNRRQSQELV